MEYAPLAIGQRPMRLLDLTLPDAAANLALDEALLLAAEESETGEVLRLWEQPSLAVVLGAGSSVAIDVNVAACAADAVPILRRASGGGTVLIGPGCLCFSLVLAYDSAPGLDDIRASNRFVLERVANALEPLVDARYEGTSDLAVNGVKISGNAQQRKRRFFLHHGTLLCGIDVAIFARYLHTPERQPDYRRDRTHSEFVTNLPLTVAEMKRLLVAEWRASARYEPAPLARVHELVVEKYSCDKWNRRR
jgi:lipoate-protein ligase A